MPIITIFGATGQQGSAILNAVLADGKYTPRGVSRSLDSDASKALIAKGVEVVVGNLFDKESLKKAIRGSEAVFGVTNFYDPAVFTAEDRTGSAETTQGKNLVDAAKEEGVKFFIWSSLPHAKELSKGVYPHLYHYDNKAAVDDYLAASGVPHAVLQTGIFGENLWAKGMLPKSENGTGYTLPVPKYGPHDPQSWTWVGHDFGASAVALLLNYADPSKGVLGKKYPVISFCLTHTELADAIAAAIKKDVKFVPVETIGLPMVDEMFLFHAKMGAFPDTPVPNPELVALGVKFGSIEEFIQTEIVPRFV
ncbi:NAD(P)-binding protein [Mycena vitilis]|nr:NAD(P)-binding protein [Mycena vitilis]